MPERASDMTFEIAINDSVDSFPPAGALIQSKL